VVDHEVVLDCEHVDEDDGGVQHALPEGVAGFTEQRVEAPRGGVVGLRQP
jgi:hypothetical protein